MILPISTKRIVHTYHGSIFLAAKGWRDLLASISLTEDSDWTTLHSKHSISQSYNTTAGFRFELENGTQLYFKRYVYTRPRLKHWLQPSKAAVELAGLQELSRLGVATPKILAYGEKRSFGIIRAAFIATLGIPQTIQLDLFLLNEWRHLPHKIKHKQLTIIKKKLINQLTAAHKAGFFHRDLKLRNILIQKSADSYNLFWIDCPRSSCCKPLNSKAIAQDLTAMARIGIHVLTAGQRMRFLIDYCDSDRVLARRYWLLISKEFNKRPPRPAWQFDPGYQPGNHSNNLP